MKAHARGCQLKVPASGLSRLREQVGKVYALGAGLLTSPKPPTEGLSALGAGLLTSPTTALGAGLLTSPKPPTEGLPEAEQVPDSGDLRSG